MAYSGKFKPINTKKYEGNPDKITYRSLWERGLMVWLDTNPDVKSWSSEEIVIPYISPVDNRAHRYFMDFKTTFVSGATMLIEVKPDYQIRPPVKKKHSKSSKFLMEAKTYAVNDAKWQAAERYAKKRGWTFVIFTEDTLENLGISIVTNKSKKQKKTP